MKRHYINRGNTPTSTDKEIETLINQISKNNRILEDYDNPIAISENRQANKRLASLLFNYNPSELAIYPY
jgi:hypothetical protein